VGKYKIQEFRIHCKLPISTTTLKLNELHLNVNISLPSSKGNGAVNKEKYFSQDLKSLNMCSNSRLTDTILDEYYLNSREFTLDTAGEALPCQVITAIHYK
jgi:hypothetical protein